MGRKPADMKTLERRGSPVAKEKKKTQSAIQVQKRHRCSSRPQRPGGKVKQGHKKFCRWHLKENLDIIM
jgi:hypothetical protein